MQRPLPFFVLFAATTLAACTSSDAPDSASDGPWVGTITTEGNVTTVVNESGSVWGGTAKLVEEASIGVETGAEEYMFGQVAGVFATDERIYVVDRQVPRVRMYDLGGNHLGDLGRSGQGPGEYNRPAFVRGDNAGRIFVLEAERRRFIVYSEEGELLGTWAAPNAMCCAYPMVVSADGTLWARVRTRAADRGERTTPYALQAHGPEGPIGPLRWPNEIEFAPVQIEVTTLTGRTFPITVPFGPRSMWATASSGAIVSGASDRYRFEIQSDVGSIVVVERYWDPVPIGPEEAEWHRRMHVAVAHLETVPPDWTWDGEEMPSTKPAFSGLVPAASGEIWVVRDGEGEHLPDCVENPIEVGWLAVRDAPCWRNTTILDVFDDEGRYLGEVESPENIRPFPTSLFVRNELVVGVVEDERGTIMVKRYRLVSPGERAP